MSHFTDVSRRKFIGSTIALSGAAASKSVAAATKNGASLLIGDKPSPVIDIRVRPPFKSFRKMVSDGAAAIPTGSSDELAMARFLARMDAVGIDLAVAMGRTAPVPGVMQITISNDDIAELVRLYPRRFLGFGSVDVRDPVGAIAEVDRCASLGLRGIAFDNPLSLPALHNDDPKLFPIYEQCVQRGLIIAINSSAMIGPDLSFSDPVHIQNVAKTFPKHPFIVTHACWPFSAEMISIVMMGIMFGDSNIYYQCDYASLVNGPGCETYLEAAKFLPVDIFKKALYGSSFPFYIPIEESISNIRSYDFGRKNIAAHIIGINAKELFRL